MTEIPGGAPLRRMADGTVKQVNPFTGTEVWTVPGRGHRPIDMNTGTIEALSPDSGEAYCAFCATRLLETTPEKSRVIRTGDHWQVLDEVAPAELADTSAEFRLFGNLFEIVSLDYWTANHGYQMPERATSHQLAYLASAEGEQHVRALVRTRIAAARGDARAVDTMDRDELIRRSRSFFGGCHDVVVARRHWVDGATESNQHASSGTLSPQEHYQFIAFTIRAMHGLYLDNPFARYVSVFQNWLKPAGASFDHLHKQLVAIDEMPAKSHRELLAMVSRPDMYDELGVGLAQREDLILAENDHAIAVVGVGHRYPSLVVYSKAQVCAPWEHTAEQQQAMSDLIHACHAATGPLVPCNEEWHTRPRNVHTPMPWRVVLKWRVSNPAGFEGATGIYINTIDPWTLRDRVAPRLAQLRADGAIAPMRLGTECASQGPWLRYLDSSA